MGLIQWNSPHGSLTLGQSGPGTFYFTVPFGVFLIFIQAYAGGGAGGSGYANIGDPNGGGGGGASGTTWAVVPVNPGDVFEIVIGAGGQPTTTDGGTTVTYGGTGSDTVIYLNGSVWLTIPGGGGGANGIDSPSNYGVGGGSPPPGTPATYLLYLATSALDGEDAGPNGGGNGASSGETNAIGSYIGAASGGSGAPSSGANGSTGGWPGSGGGGAFDESDATVSYSGAEGYWGGVYIAY